MRPMLLTTARIAILTSALMIAAATGAAAAPRAPVVVAPVTSAPTDEPLPPMTEDQAQADAMTAQLTALDARIGADDARLSQLRDAELAKENARIRAIKPALPYGGRISPFGRS